jgi:nicotinate-nucleotide adenylyltransferase
LRDQVVQRRVADSNVLRQRAAGHIYFSTVTQLDISATRIRRLFGSGESPRYLLPDSVLDFALRNGLYSQTPADAG